MVVLQIEVQNKEKLNLRNASSLYVSDLRVSFYSSLQFYEDCTYSNKSAQLDLQLSCEF